MNTSFMLNTSTVMYGVFGYPVKHSRSPVMMNRAFQTAGMDAAYAAFEVAPDGLKSAIEGIRALGFGGVNVTIPHKEEVMRLMDEVDETARVIGAVNTVVNDHGKLIGYNTDGIGYVRSLQEETGESLRGKRILILGAGGATRGVVYSLLQEKPERVVIANRTLSKAEAVAQSLRSYGDVEAIDLGQVPAVIAACPIIIHTSSVGMHPQVRECLIDPAILIEGSLVSDLIYNPLETMLLREAKRQGCRIHGGLGMFIYQGAYAFEYWTGRLAPVAEMRDAVMTSFAHAGA